MIALDTNVLVRYLIQDDPEQSLKATQLLDTLSASNKAFIYCIVLCETFWVLKTSYQLPKASLVTVFNGILSVPVLDIEYPERCLMALHNYQMGRADFPDYLIKSIANHYGYHRILTFDKTAAQNDGFALL
ncbi:MAG: PIN domain-containing protein [Alphaproteobacteria bacterium]